MSIAMDEACPPPDKMSVFVTIDQAWISGVALSLMAPDGVTVLLMERPGADVGDFGLSSNLGKDHPLRFIASGNSLSLLPACWPANSDVVCDLDTAVDSCGWDAQCSFAPGESFESFTATTAGLWHFCAVVDEDVGDYAATLSSVTIEISHA